MLARPAGDKYISHMVDYRNIERVAEVARSRKKFPYGVGERKFGPLLALPARRTARPISGKCLVSKRVLEV